MRLAALLVLAGVVMSSAPAFAQVEGCDQQVLETQQAVAEARVSENKALDDEIFVQDDSVLALTCFNQSAAISAKQSGDVFSGDFRADIKPIVDDALQSMYSNFRTHTLGGSTNPAMYSNGGAAAVDATSASLTYQCDGIRGLWDAVNNAGVVPDAPYATQSEMLDNNNMTGSGAAYQAARSNPASQARRTNASNLVAARTPPSQMPTPPPNTSLCTVLQIGNLINVAATCPPP